MTEKHLHIITHDVPWPADFGGVIDLFYKIKALHRYGIKIHLHCFTGKRPAQDELKKYCETVNYYPRKNYISAFSFRIPFIVSSRKSNRLVEELRKDNYPVLIEGIHCTYALFKHQLKNRKVFIRLHNAEFEYYHYLATYEQSFFKKLYFTLESKLLKRYEALLSKDNSFIAVSKKDVKIYRENFNTPSISYLPVFLPYTNVAANIEKGCFCLYHGNLSINENEECAIWLLQHVFNGINIPFVLAGKNPSAKLEAITHLNQNSCLVANPDDRELQDLIRKAQINILPSFNNTGVKLKLLNALFNGKHCVVNKSGVDGSGLEEACHLAENPQQFQRLINRLYHQPFTLEELERREKLLEPYNIDDNTEKLIQLFW